MIKKILKFTGITLGVILLILLILPFAFKGKITKIAKEQINNQVNADVDFENLSLSFIKHFPSLSVDLQGLSVVNRAPFVGDTLAYVGHAMVDVNVMSLVSGTPKMNKIKIADVTANVFVNKDSVANYDIALPSEDKEAVEEVSGEAAPFQLAIEKYELENINVKYVDSTSNMSALVKNFNHLGTGDLSHEEVLLDTHTNADAITFMMDDVAYLKDLQLKYDAEVGVNYAKDLVLTFKDNVIHFNDLNLAFDGVFKMLPEVFEMKFDFKSEKSPFKSLLSLIPNAYTKDFPNVTANGALDLHGFVDGVYSENSIPKLDVVIKTENASVKYPDLAKTIQNIHLDTHISNTTGVMDDLVTEVKHFGFKIDEDVFSASTTVSKPISNLTVDANVKGKVNLGNLAQAYPIPDLGYDLHGLVKADVSTAFNMNALDAEQYDQIKNKGSIQLTDVEVGSEFTPEPVEIKVADLMFDTKKVDLTQFSIKTGKSDVQLKGGLQNLYAYLFNDQKLKGNLHATSKNFYVNDFLTATDTTAVNQPVVAQDSVAEEQLKIPDNIHFVSSIKADQVVYDDIVMRNFVGNAEMKDQKMIFHNASTQMFQGTMGIKGMVDTKPAQTLYDFDLDIKQFDIASAFTSLDMLAKIAPIAKAFKGRFDTDFKVKGVLGNDFMPDLNKMTGLAAANLQVDKLDTKSNKFLALADDKMSFLNLANTDLKDLKGKFSFRDGKAHLAPVDFKFKDIPMTISGNHSFDQQMNYNLKLDLPAKYLGSKATSLVSKLSAQDQENVKVPLNVSIGGTITKPTVVPNMKDAISQLAKSTIDAKKKEVTQKVKEKAKQEVGKQLKNILGGTDDKDGSTDKKEDVKKAGKKLLKGLFGK